MRRPPRIVVVWLVTGLLLVFPLGALFSVEFTGHLPLSPSPLNTDPGGTSGFYLDLDRNIGVWLGGAGDLRGPGVVYLVIGPDRPFTRAEALAIAGAVEEGARALLADETGNIDPVLEALGLPVLGGLVYNESSRGGGWEWTVSIHCSGLEGVYYSTRVARVEQGPGTVVCRAGDGSPVAVQYRVGEGTVLVVGDSTLFANFLYEEGYGPLPPTRPIAWFLFNAVYEPGYRVVWDNEHYGRTGARIGTAPLTGMAAVAVDALSSLRERVVRAEPWQLMVYGVLAVLPWPLIFFYPGEAPGRGRDPLEEHTAWLLLVEAERAGLEGVGDPRGMDPEKVARRILGVVERGGPVE